MTDSSDLLALKSHWDAHADALNINIIYVHLDDQSQDGSWWNQNCLKPNRSETLNVTNINFYYALKLTAIST